MDPDPPAEPAPHGLGHREFIALTSLVNGTIAISIDTVLPAFDEIETEFGLDPNNSGVSLTVTVFFAAMGIATLFYGPVSDRFGRKPVLFGSLLLFIGGAMVSTFASTFPVFLAGRAVWGAAAAGPRTVSLAMIRDSYEGDRMARIMSFSMAVFLVVPILAPSLGELLLLAGSWRWTTGASILLGVVVGLWLLRARETLHPDDVLPLRFGRVGQATREVLTHPATILFTVAGTMAYGAFLPWLGSSVEIIGDIYDRPGQFAFFFAVNGTIVAAAVLFSARIVSRRGAYRVLVVQSTLIVITATILVVWSETADGVPSFWVFITLATLLTALNSASTPLTQTLAMEPMGAIAGTASSVIGVAFLGLGALLGAITDGYINDTITPFGLGFLVYGGLGLAAIVAARHRR